MHVKRRCNVEHFYNVNVLKDLGGKWVVGEYVGGHILVGFLEHIQKVSSKRNLNKMHQNHFETKEKNRNQLKTRMGLSLSHTHKNLSNLSCQDTCTSK